MKTINYISLIFILISCSNEKYPIRPLDDNDDVIYTIVVDTLYFAYWKNWSDFHKRPLKLCIIDSTFNNIIRHNGKFENLDTLPKPITAEDSLEFNFKVQNQRRFSIGERLSKYRPTKIFPDGSWSWDLSKESGEVAIVLMSAIGIYNDLAEVYYEFSAGSLYGGGRVVYLKKINNKWIITEIRNAGDV